MTRYKAEAVLAVPFGAGLLLAGGAATYLISTLSVHTDPGAIPSTASAAPAERYSGAVEEARRMTRSLLVEENLPGLPVAVALGGRASLYFPRMAMRTDLGLQDAPRAGYSCWAGAGAFLSTPSDLVKFGSAMLRPGLLKAETIALLQTPLQLESGVSTGYALGWKAEAFAKPASQRGWSQPAPNRTCGSGRTRRQLRP